MRQSRLTRTMLHLANVLVILFFLLPLIAALIGALQSERSLQAETRSLLPPEWTLDNFRVILSGGTQKGAIFEQATYLPDNVKKIYYALANSAMITIAVTVLTTAFAALSAYTVVRLNLRWVIWLMSVNVFARFVPIIVLMIPLYVTFRQMGLLNSIWGVIIALTGFLLPYGILILAPYFATIPRELDDAARIDGCSRFSAFLRVTLPLSTPALASYGAIVFIISWNDLLIPLILNNRAEFMTLPVVIASLVGDVHVFFNLLMAICLIALTPSVVLVLLLRKFVVQGLAVGGVKG
ncbi:carbohydrate ABC transporter permease [Limobrevibacterium gyesilva]|uniref:sn-glycerol-3-phosphate transport system permease protein UgpE n=1 Tax=Limobrevibacterium gyesilva TaxID=2991712 RepID=A0AA41YNU6_9PROT|nr:carbohydrate ABC transporter permease [Limobrevibacterium gyesilva]MCW3476145.1 carbohydrate ABC transporter permease [Limobrevibacterium gyesilva]